MSEDVKRGNWEENNTDGKKELSLEESPKVGETENAGHSQEATKKVTDSENVEAIHESWHPPVSWWILLFCPPYGDNTSPLH